MTLRILTPHEFCQLKTMQERNKAYSDLWDAWQTKGEKKEVLNQKVKKTKLQRKKGAAKTNELSKKASDFLIKQYWNAKHSQVRVTAKFLLNKLHQQPETKVKHLSQKVVQRWYTAIKRTWDKTAWPTDEDACSEFSDRALENYQIIIKRKLKTIV